MHANLRIKYKKSVTLLPVVVLVLIDQIVKYGIRHSGGFYICNKGVAFGVDVSWVIYILVAVIFLIFVYFNNQDTSNNNQKIFKFQYSISKPFEHLVNWLLKFVCSLHLGGWLLRVDFLFILSGGISNLADRVFFGCVIDFIDMKFWPVFNLADVYITIGSMGLLTVIFKKGRI